MAVGQEGPLGTRAVRAHAEAVPASDVPWADSPLL